MLPKTYDPKATEDQPPLRKSGATAGKPLPKVYDPQSVEDRIYQMWEESGAFRADGDSKKEPFTISMPPPNATGNLHLGHAVMLALEDIFIRFARMQGKEALWVPGTDHAAIATENVVIRMLKEQGMKDPRKEFGREGLVAKIAEYVEKSRGTIRSQIRKMGSSCDWSRERYTMDPQLNRCVNEVFKRMYDDGLIYRGHRIVNWDPRLQTTVSDDEVDWVEETAPFYTFQYGPFQISTARPETKFGDKYVVVHPDDERYRDYAHGQAFACEWINGPIRATVIKDKAVDPAFGTGCMTITPWHDAIDFEIAERHGLEKEQIIGFDGKLLSIAGEFAGQAIADARPRIVEKLEKKGLLVKTDSSYVHRKAVSQRGCGTIEPQVKWQWFIDVHRPAVLWKGEKMSLKEVMHDVVHHGDIRIIPERFNKTYFHWIDNLRDWCISRQIWWGHRVPVWYCIGDDHCVLQCKEPLVSVFPPEKCPHCGSKSLAQDPDTLDTWFSSALWTWSTLVDPNIAADPSLTLEQILEKSPDYKRFHPTTVMETGYDILFFWVARMILMTTYATGQMPFKTVYLHGLIRTRDGRKMSKSHPETMIDPLDMIEKYGADALRLSMIVGQSPGADSRLYEEKIAGYRNFVNKLWNASRFILMECEQAKIKPSFTSEADPSSIADQALMFELIQLRNDVTSGIERYWLSETGEKLYTFVWDFFCDWYLEMSKGTANPGILVVAMREILQLLHPYCPFVTEELWSHFKQKDAPMLIKYPWPLPLSILGTPWEESRNQLQAVISVVTALRKIRADQGMEVSKKITVFIYSKKHAGLLEDHREHIARMAKVGTLSIDAKPKKHTNAASAFLSGIEVHVSLEGVVDPAAMQKGRESLTWYIQSLETKLANRAFITKAPAHVVDEMRAKLTEERKKLVKLEERLRSLQ